MIHLVKFKTIFFLQIETYAYHLPHASLANLVDIFISLSVLDDSLYNLCHLDDFKFLADMIEHIKLPLKAKLVFDIIKNTLNPNKLCFAI